MGKWVAVRKDDIIETEMLDSFIYDLSQNTCTEQNKEKCDDEFKYIPYG